MGCEWHTFGEFARFCTDIPLGERIPYPLRNTLGDFARGDTMTSANHTRKVAVAGR